MSWSCHSTSAHLADSRETPSVPAKRVEIKAIRSGITDILAHCRIRPELSEREMSLHFLIIRIWGKVNFPARTTVRKEKWMTCLMYEFQTVFFLKKLLFMIPAICCEITISDKYFLTK
jgi:hypothetical protein